MMLTETKKRLLKKLAKQSIAEDLLGEDMSWHSDVQSIAYETGAFVTLHLDGDLRGCIGLIETSQPLYLTVYQMAKRAAFNDPRFSPLTKAEFSRISIEISVLTVPEIVDDVSSIVVGEHGLIVSKDSYRGLLLPQVPLEWGWDRLTFLQQTAIKAGLEADEWKVADVLSFKAIVF